MNRLSLKSRLNLSISFALLVLVFPATANADSLRAFNAVYNIYKGSMHVANSKFSLEQIGDSWRLRTSVEPRGFFKLFTRKKPVSETIFNLHEKGIHLQQIKITDSRDKKKSETARFDWENGQLEVKRKSKHRQYPIGEDVHDFQSIHLLAAAMQQQQLGSITVDFYNRGKLSKSSFVYSGKGTVKVDGKKIECNIFEQVTTRSKAKLKYYYDPEHPMLPLRIETTEAGESSTVIAMTSVDWSL